MLTAVLVTVEVTVGWVVVVTVPTETFILATQKNFKDLNLKQDQTQSTVIQGKTSIFGFQVKVCVQRLS